MRWLSLSCRVVEGTDARPEQVLGVVTATSVLRRSADDVSRIQWLTAALDDATTVRDVSRVVVTALREPLGADRVALAELQDDRLMVTVLDPPQPTRLAGASGVPVALGMARRAGQRPAHPADWRCGTDAWTCGPPAPPSNPDSRASAPEVWPCCRSPPRAGSPGVCLVGWDQPHEFAPEERSLLTATAGLVGQALKRAHAHDAEQELATMLQRSLLPRRLPELPGGTAVARYLPARRGLQVGGDWYDVIALSEERVALVIGDVQGHSAGAATIMGQMRTAVRAYAVEGHPPDVVVSHANRLLVGMETDLFATCCYVELDMEEGNTLFVRAGHLSPLVRHPDGSTEEVQVEGGLPLGILAEAEFPHDRGRAGPRHGARPGHRRPGRGRRPAPGRGHAPDAYRARRGRSGGPGADGRRTARGQPAVARTTWRCCCCATTAWRPGRSGPAGWCGGCPTPSCTPAASPRARCVGGTSTEAADAVLLVVSELVTNALVHTQGAVRVDLMLRGGPGAGLRERLLAACARQAGDRGLGVDRRPGPAPGRGDVGVLRLGAGGRRQAGVERDRCAGSDPPAPADQGHGRNEAVCHEDPYPYHLVAALVAGLMAMSLAACGGDDETGTDSFTVGLLLPEPGGCPAGSTPTSR